MFGTSSDVKHNDERRWDRESAAACARFLVSAHAISRRASQGEARSDELDVAIDGRLAELQLILPGDLYDSARDLWIACTTYADNQSSGAGDFVSARERFVEAARHFFDLRQLYDAVPLTTDASREG
jgi:hypothetical protein